MNFDEELKIEIITHREATQKELSDLKNIARFSGIESFTVENKIIRKMGADLPPEVLILIWVSGCIVGGFFGAIGQDLWKSLKRFISKTFDYYKDEEEPEYKPNILLEIRVESELSVRIIFPTRNFEELRKGLAKLDEYLKGHKLDKFLALYFYEGKWMTQGEYLQEQSILTKVSKEELV